MSFQVCKKDKQRRPMHVTSRKISSVRWLSKKENNDLAIENQFGAIKHPVMWVVYCSYKLHQYPSESMKWTRERKKLFVPCYVSCDIHTRILVTQKHLSLQSQIHRTPWIVDANRSWALWDEIELMPMTALQFGKYVCSLRNQFRLCSLGVDAVAWPSLWSWRELNLYDNDSIYTCFCT